MDIWLNALAIIGARLLQRSQRLAYGNLRVINRSHSASRPKVEHASQSLILSTLPRPRGRGPSKLTTHDARGEASVVRRPPNYLTHPAEASSTCRPPAAHPRAIARADVVCASPICRRDATNPLQICLTCAGNAKGRMPGRYLRYPPDPVRLGRCAPVADSGLRPETWVGACAR